MNLSAGRTAALVLGLLIVPLSAVIWLVSPPDRLASSTAPPSGALPASSAPPSRSSPEGAGAVERSRRVAQSDPGASRSILRAALAERPDDSAAMSALAQKLLIDESTEARGLAERCLALAPGDTGCAEVFRRGLEAERRDDRTTKFLDDCLAQDATRVPCLTAALVERLRAQDARGAEGVLARLREADPAHPLTKLASARVLSAQGRYAEARAHFEASCEAGQGYACFRAEALRRDGW